MKKNFTILSMLLTFGISYSQVGIGTTNPQGALDITSTTGALVPPRLTTTERDALTTSYRPTGSVIYNTSDNCLQMNAGTPATPDWGCVQQITNISGADYRKVLYSNISGDPSKTISLGRFEFRINSSNVPEFRLKEAPVSNITIPYELGQYWQTNGFEFAVFERTFTTTNYSIWQDCSASSGNAMSTQERNELWIAYPTDTNDLYNVNFVAIGKSPSTSATIWGIFVTKY